MLIKKNTHMSCLFNSIGGLLGIHGSEVRNSICDYLESGKPLITGVKTEDILRLDTDIPNYVKTMRSSSTWGGAIEIRAACNLYQMRVVLKTGSGQNIEFLPTHGSTINRTLFLNWNGNHYERIYCGI